MRVLNTKQADEWMGVLKRSCQHDFYFLPGYHALAEDRGEGEAALFVYEQDGYMVALPLLLRSLRELPHFPRVLNGLSDATSVYGYAGPIASHPDIPEQVAQGFRYELSRAMRERGAVTVFSRLHPLIVQTRLLAGLGEVLPLGQTVSIDLTLPAEAQRKLIRQNHRRDISKLQRMGVTCTEDREWTYLQSFADLYEQTMRRVSARDSYHFGIGYFHELRRRLEPNSRLFVALRNGDVIAGGMFIACDGIVQYHLGGTRDDALALAPMKLVFDTVRIWAAGQGLRFLHLGGGVGSQEDSLFHFKAGFSDRRHDFACWRWVVRQEQYEQLCEEAVRLRIQNGLPATLNGYFPAYRSPSLLQGSQRRSP